MMKHQNFAQYLITLLHIIANDGSMLNVRQLAAIQFKNSLTSKNAEEKEMAENVE